MVLVLSRYHGKLVLKKFPIVAADCSETRSFSQHCESNTTHFSKGHIALVIFELKKSPAALRNLHQNLMFRDLHQKFGSRGEIVRLQREPTDQFPAALV